MRVLVTGSQGMLGTGLLKVLARENEVLGVDKNEMDITDYAQVLKTFSSFNPEVVCHLAAMTDVDQSQNNPEVFRVNAGGTANLVTAAKKTGSRFLYVSTLAVFGGTQKTPYRETDPCFPNNTYAESKWLGERIIQSCLSEYFIIRSGWIFGGGPADKKFVRKILDLSKKTDSIQAVTDKTGSLTYTVDLSAAISALIKTRAYGTYHAVNQGVSTRYEITKKILEFAGTPSVRVVPVTSDAFILPAPRPDNESGSSEKLSQSGIYTFRRWEDALKEYIQEITGTDGYAKKK
ncbi:MAG: dTDP-4-dehydrorhamnose reductase [Candidatus Diapherotrites archaeon]|nr:dTDP-4-dehydrorhamnose reductase [Candidatus Diapherotrites archaeon]